MDQVAVITGATAGIGRAFADLLAAQGYDLVLIARDEQRLNLVCGEIVQKHGVECRAMPADLSRESDRKRVAELVEREAEVLINNAGFGVREAFNQSTVADERTMLDVMVVAVMELSHAALRGMSERGSGVILNVSSVASWTTSGTYAAAKAWVTNFSEGLNAMYAGTGIHVTALCPGYVRTEFHERMGVSMKAVPNWMWLSADAVAHRAWSDAQRGKAVSVPGWQYKPLGLLLRHAPRWFVRATTSSKWRPHRPMGD